MTIIHRPRRSWPLACAFLLSFGCGASQTGAPADPSRAQEALHAALDAWKGGQPLDALAQRSPPIRVSDLDWSGGLRLEGYQAEGAGQLLGYDLNYPVV